MPVITTEQWIIFGTLLLTLVLFIMGPGGYKFGDYWRMGLLLEIIVAVPLILIFWPL